MPEYNHGETAYLPDEHYRNLTINAIMAEGKPMAFLKVNQQYSISHTIYFNSFVLKCTCSIALLHI